ncbi:lytic transglycosylase domain-containing protein [Oryzibacter oryziterrae]|uniref:lytic transglycosylase domain-containing protein n=1 Tax=Oryzibacter oryziterrae TaxID=2766474 RepID=UPI001F15F3B4|nr:lytic transglycosylase domain-containing protein [Oryzibacter oryziterrae]
MKPVFQWVYAQPPQRTVPNTSTSNAGISGRIQQAFDAASDSTGTSFQYLLDTAQRESALNTEAKASTSSATGLFQFVEGTWLETMKQSGPELGLSQYSDQITQDSRGRYFVADPKARDAILSLRNDPEVASLMAGAYTRKNAEFLQGKLGREATSGELYIAHFLGAQGAAQLINSAASSPNQSASELFPKQANANRAIFYDKGQPRSVSEVYANLVAKHGNDSPLVPASDRVMTAFDALGVNGEGDPTSGLAYADGTGATNEIKSGWKAADSSDAFSSLFRNNVSKNPVAAAAFWRGFSQTPGMFDVAVAVDAAAMAKSADSAARLSAALRAVQPGQIPPTDLKDGPLDLAQFLKDS